MADLDQKSCLFTALVFDCSQLNYMLQIGRVRMPQQTTTVLDKHKQNVGGDEMIPTQTPTHSNW